MLRLELHRVARVVDEGKAGGASTTESGAHAEDDALLLGGLVHLRELLRELSLGDVRAGRVDDIQNHLLPLEQTVGDELASSEGDRRSGVLPIVNSMLCKMPDMWLVKRTAVRKSAETT